MAQNFTAIRGPVLTPTSKGEVVFYPDALFTVSHGKIQKFYNKFSNAPSELSSQCKTYGPTDLIIPGMIDGHTHFAQMKGVGVFGETLLEWLEKAIFPIESNWDRQPTAIMEKNSAQFLRQLLRHGTTSALIFGVSMPKVVDAFLQMATAFPMRVVSGLALMDRNAPKSLIPTRDISEWKDLVWSQIQRFHGQGNVHYAICPRYAPCCSQKLMRLCGDLMGLWDDLYLQTHISENDGEVTWVKRLFAKHKSYATVYEDFGMLTPRSFLAHGVQCNATDRKVLERSGAQLIHCPTANFFLGSGIFPFQTDLRDRVAGWGTDVGAGTTFSILKVAGHAYQAAMLQGVVLPIEELFLGCHWTPAQALGWKNVGWLGEGAAADFAVLSSKVWSPDPLLQELWEERNAWTDRLFLAMTQMDQPTPILDTWFSGRRVYSSVDSIDAFC